VCGRIQAIDFLNASRRKALNGSLRDAAAGKIHLRLERQAAVVEPPHCEKNQIHHRSARREVHERDDRTPATIATTRAYDRIHARDRPRDKADDQQIENGNRDEARERREKRLERRVPAARVDAFDRRRGERRKREAQRNHDERGAEPPAECRAAALRRAGNPAPDVGPTRLAVRARGRS
jgi:hypothetical protein